MHLGLVSSICGRECEGGKRGLWMQSATRAAFRLKGSEFGFRDQVVGLTLQFQTLNPSTPPSSDSEIPVVACKKRVKPPSYMRRRTAPGRISAS